MWIPNGIASIIIFAALCTAIKKAWLKHQANKYKHFSDNYYNTDEETD